MTCQHGVGISRFLGLQPTCMFIVVVICCVFFFLWVIMPLLPLCYRLLNKLDDVNHSFKCAHLSKYLQDISIKPFIPPTSNSDSHDSDLSLLSSLSSLSSISSFNLDNKSSFQPTPFALAFGHWGTVLLDDTAWINMLHQEILTSRVLCKNPTIMKASQIHLLKHWHHSNLNQYRRQVYINPNIFNSIINKICSHKIFYNNSNVPQTLIKVQLSNFFILSQSLWGTLPAQKQLGTGLVLAQAQWWTVPTVSWWHSYPYTTNLSTFWQLRRRRAQRHGLQGRCALSGVMAISWSMEQNSCCSSGLAFMAMPGLTRISPICWTARYVPIFINTVAIWPFTSLSPYLIPLLS